MMDKYGVESNEGREVRIVAGPLKGREGIVKEATPGKLKVELTTGQTVTIDEGAAKEK